MAKQVTFLDMEDEPYTKYGGIMLDNGDVICGCCGGLYEAAQHNKTWKLLKEFGWYNLDNEILKNEYRKEIDKLQDEFAKGNLTETRNILNKLKDKLGLDHPEVFAVDTALKNMPAST